MEAQPLINWLKKFILTERQEKILTCALGFDGQVYHSFNDFLKVAYKDHHRAENLKKAEFGSFRRDFENEKRSAVIKIEKALSLSGKEYQLLAAALPFYKKLKEILNGKSFEERFEEVVKKSKEGRMVPLTRAWSLPLTARLKRLALSDNQRKVLFALLGLEGKKYTQFRDVIFDLFAKEGQTKTEAYLRYGFQIRDTMHSGFPKVKAALNLPKGEFIILQQLDSFYARLQEVYPNKPIEELGKIIQEVRSKKGPRFGIGQKFFLSTIEKLSPEKKINALILAPWQEKVLLRICQLEGKKYTSLSDIARELGMNPVSPHSIYKRAAHKIKFALEKLSSEEYKNLAKTDIFYARLKEVYPEITFDKVNELYQKTKSAKYFFAFGKIETLSLSEKIGMLKLSEKEIFLLSAVYQLDGKIYHDAEEICQAGEIQSPHAYYALYHIASQKVKFALEKLSSEEYEKLTQTDSFYAQLKKIYPQAAFLNLHQFYQRLLQEKKKAQKTTKEKEIGLLYGSLEIYRREILNIAPLADSDIDLLIERVKQEDKEATKTLYESSLRYILPVAYAQMWNKFVQEKGFRLQDLIQEGNLGAWMAFLKKRFDYKKTWEVFVKGIAKYAIRGAVFEQPIHHLIRLTPYQLREVRRLMKAIIQLKEKLDREPTNEELAKELKKSLEGVKDTKAAMQIYCSYTVSYDGPIKNSEEDSGVYSEIIADQNAADPAKTIENKIIEMFKEHANTYINKVLSPTEQLVIRLRYGFEDYSFWPQDKIAQILQINSQMIAYIEQEALEKLRKNEEVISKIRAVAEITSQTVFSLPFQSLTMDKEKKKEKAPPAFSLPAKPKWEDAKEKPLLKRITPHLYDEEGKYLYEKFGLIPALAWFFPAKKE